MSDAKHCFLEVLKHLLYNLDFIVAGYKFDK